MPQPLYPEIEVKLIGEDGNAHSIIGRVARAMRRDSVAATRVDEFREEAMSGNYDKVLQTAMKFVTVN